LTWCVKGGLLGVLKENRVLTSSMGTKRELG